MLLKKTRKKVTKTVSFCLNVFFIVIYFKLVHTFSVLFSLCPISCSGIKLCFFTIQSLLLWAWAHSPLLLLLLLLTKFPWLTCVITSKSHLEVSSNGLLLYKWLLGVEDISGLNLYPLLSLEVGFQETALGWYHRDPPLSPIAAFCTSLFFWTLRWPAYQPWG